MTAFQMIETRVSKCSVAQLQEMAVKLQNDISDEAGVVLNVVLVTLEAKMTEFDFISFCEAL